MILVLSTSLAPKSRSRTMVGLVADDLRALGAEIVQLDLRDHPLPFCGPDDSYSAPGVDPLRKLISGADAVIIGVPIYNYDASAALKNLIELTGKAWEDKILAFVCAAGGRSSYMAPMSLANSMMLDFRCLIIPRFVYATGEEFDGVELVDDDTRERLQQIAEATHTTTRALRG